MSIQGIIFLNRKNTLFLAGILLIFLCRPTFVMAQDNKPESADPMADWSVIEKEYKALRADRDNILAQVKAAYEDKNKVLDELREVKAKLEKANSDKDEISKKIETLEKEK